MNAGEMCNRLVVVAYKDMSLHAAAKLMRERHVGSLVVVVDRLADCVPIGVLTDRDLTVGVLAKDLDPRTLRVSDVISTELYTVREEDSITDTLRLMRERGVRRVPVVTRNGALAGIITFDDILDVVAEQLRDLVHAVGRESVREAHLRP